MKKIVLIAIISIPIIVVLYLWLKNETLAPKAPASSSITTTQGEYQVNTPTKGYQAPLGDNDTKTQWIIIRDTKKITLHSNLTEKLTAKEALAKNGCLYLISGGFYDQNENHIGLFISEGEKLNEAQENSLFNAYFAISQNGIPSITTSPTSSARFAIQSGPLIFKNGAPVGLSLARDEEARRIVVATTRNNQVVFVAIYDASNTVLGPKLADLPSIIENVQNNSQLDFKEALNLDGGVHSAFISDIVNLPEISPIGSYFCIKP